MAASDKLSSESKASRAERETGPAPSEAEDTPLGATPESAPAAPAAKVAQPGAQLRRLSAAGDRFLQVTYPNIRPLLGINLVGWLINTARTA